MHPSRTMQGHDQIKWPSIAGKIKAKDKVVVFDQHFVLKIRDVLIVIITGNLACSAPYFASRHSKRNS